MPGVSWPSPGPAVSSCSIAGIGLSTGWGLPRASTRPQSRYRASSPSAADRVVLLGGSEVDRPALNSQRITLIVLLAHPCSAHCEREARRLIIRTLQVGSMTSGSSNSSRAGAGLPESRRSRRACVTILRREPGGPVCFGPRRAREPSRGCSRRCAIWMCGIFCAKFPFRRWCSTGGATAPSRIGAGRYLASHIAQACFIELDGTDHWFFAGDQQPVLASIGQFVGSLAA